MAGNRDRESIQLSLEPGKLQEIGQEVIHQDWQHVVQTHQPCEGLCIGCFNGRPGSQWSFRAEGPPAFSVNILLEGHFQAAFDDGAVLDAKAGSTILMASGQYATGWNVLDGQSESSFRMISINMPQSALVHLTGLHMDDLRQRARPLGGEQEHIDAFLGVVPASSSLKRVASDLLNLEDTHPGPCMFRNLYLRAKALEAIACFLRENLAPAQIQLPVPADRARLMNARALLEESYGKDWSVHTLARSVGLNEKRLQAGFHALFGCSVHTCLTRIRLNTAITLLQQGTSVTETAAMVGFAHLSHFSKVFRGYTGISPKQCAQGISPSLR
jgi:AraC-like DNA-binding protein/uncharacterized cupin superfamily protein